VDSLSAGCNYLIKQGAAPLIDIEEFCDDFLADFLKKRAALVPSAVKKKRQPARPAPAKKRGFGPDEEQVLAALDYTPYPLERIAGSCPQIARERLLKILITFCLKGVACQMGAGNYCLTNETV
jgi:predicted Rossmann fold nucleotide-binding protein DprA/Smf involved in DNA uptake